MAKPILKVGDVVTTRFSGFQFVVLAILKSKATGKRYVELDQGLHYVAKLGEWKPSEIVKVHRPTPAGLVQVWPEVKG